MASKSLLIFAGLIMVCAIFANFTFFADRNRIPRHMMGHNLVDRPNFLSAETVEELLTETRKSSPIYSTIKEPSVFKTVEDNIGEAVPVIVDDRTGEKSCPNMMAFDNTGKRCILPGRYDVGKHYMMTGGPEGRKEPVQKLVSRVQPFLHYILDYKKYPLTKKMLESKEMLAFAKNICPKDKQYIEPFQFNYVVQVPGQTVATHVDGVYFRHASRFHMPQWLLAVMHFSGLFQDEFIPQVQIVAYYHKWTDDRKGQFLFWNDPETRKPQYSNPISRSANSVDGSMVVHAADVYMPSETPPILPRAANNTLVYERLFNDHTWHVFSNGQLKKSYRESELRFSAVYRCKCFKDKADATQYVEDQKPGKAWTTTYVIDILRRDMAAKGVAAFEETSADKMPRLQLADLLLKTYVKYPLSPTAMIPYNLCAVSELESLKMLTPYMKYFGC